MLDRTTFWACALYAATLLICFGSSTCYHAHFSNPYLMMIWQRIDHMGIYLLIAGSYTVLLFVGCRGSYRVVAVTILEWVAAFIGCIVPRPSGVATAFEGTTPCGATPRK